MEGWKAGRVEGWKVCRGGPVRRRASQTAGNGIALFLEHAVAPLARTAGSYLDSATLLKGSVAKSCKDANLMSCSMCSKYLLIQRSRHSSSNAEKRRAQRL